MSSRYWQNISEGKCGNCGMPVTDGNHLCEKCREDSKKRRKETRDWLRDNGYCTRCGKRKAFGSRKYCEYCLEKNQNEQAKSRRERKDSEKEKLKAQYEYRKANGLCTRCGKPAVSGLTSCDSCRAKQRKYWRKRRKEFDFDYIPREERTQTGLCYFCGKTAIDGKRVCVDCLKRICALNAKKGMQTMG